jgi:hypothetical protein
MENTGMLEKKFLFSGGFGRYCVLKVVAVQIAFLLLHFAYDWAPSGFVSIFSGVNESTFQHLKIGFFSYTLVTILEYLFLIKKQQTPGRFIFARIGAISFYPWLIFLIYFIVPSFYGELHSFLGEIIYANVALIVSTVLTVFIERQWEKQDPDRTFKWAVVFLFLLSLALYIVCTYRLPWVDMFATPPGWE